MPVGLEIRSKAVLTVVFLSKRGDQFTDAPAWHQQIDVLAGLERRQLTVWVQCSAGKVFAREPVALTPSPPEAVSIFHISTGDIVAFHIP